MDERYRVSHGVERESTASMVKEHTDAGGIRCFDLYLVFIVTGWVAGVGAEEAPGLAVVSNAAAVSVTGPLNAFVCDTNGSSLPAPVSLPVVCTTREGFFTQDLGQGVKPGRAVTEVLGVSL